MIKRAALILTVAGSKEGSYRITTDANGTGRILVSNFAPGEYAVSIETNDSNLNTASASSKIIITKIPAVINVESLIEYFNSGNTATVKLTDSSGNPLSGVYIRFRLYESSAYSDYVYKTGTDGRASLLTSLDVGSHKIIFSCLSNVYLSSDVTKSITVKKASGVLSAKSKLKVHYLDGKYLTVKLTNSKNKKPIYNAKLQIRLYVSKNRYITYHGTTQSQGKMVFNVNLKPGSYKVTVSGEDSKNFNVKGITSKITVKKAKFKLASKKLSGKYYSFKVLNKHSKKPVSKTKLKVKVYTGKKYKTFTVKTSKNGIAKLKVKSLKKGSHKAVVSLPSKLYSNSVKTKIKV